MGGGTQGRPPGVIGLWPSRAVTFIDNHDTGSTLQHWPFPAEHVGEGYCYLLTHPGTPCVLIDHWDDPQLREVRLLPLSAENAVLGLVVPIAFL